MRTGLTKLQAAAITAAPTEEQKVRAAAEVMVERPLDLIKHILMKHETAVIEVMREQQERIATLESVLRVALGALEKSRGLEPVDIDWVKGQRKAAIKQIREVLNAE